MLLITTSLDVGGEELSTFTIARELRRRGHHVVWLSTDGPLRKEIEEEGIPLLSAPIDGRGPLGFLRGALAIRRLLARMPVDIIHCQSVVPAVMASLARLGRVPRKPRIIWHDRLIKGRSYPLVARLFNHCADFVIANSNYERDKLVRHGLKSQKVRTIHNCLNFAFPQVVPKEKDLRLLADLAIDSDEAIIGTVGRLHPRKGGYQGLLRAMALVYKETPRCKLLVVGTGPLECELRALAKALGIEGQVIFAGVRRDLVRLYPLIDLFVLASRAESFGNVLVEAMSFARPVVATQVGGIPEVVTDGQTGLLVPPGDPRPLAAAILRLLGDRAMARRMGEAGRERVRNYFCPTRLGDELEEVYERLVSAHGNMPE